MEKAGKLISGALCWLIAAAAGILGFYYAVLPGTLSAETFGHRNRELLRREGYRT